MKNYNYALSLTSQFYFCGIPYRLDSSSECPLKCTYCFSQSRGGHRGQKSLETNPLFFREKLYRAFNKDIKENCLNSELLQHRLPIHFGGMSDPFSNQQNSKISRQLLSALSEYDYPVIISTKKSDELVNKKTMKILQSMTNVVIQISISIPNDKLSKKIEPRSPSTKERIKSLEELSNCGFYTIARVQPIFFPLTGEINQELIPDIGSAGCKQIITEHLKIPIEKKASMKKIFSLLNWDGYDFYKKNHSQRIGREWLLPNELKWKNLQPLIHTIHKNHMIFGCGDYGLNHLGDTNCCCGIDNVKGFSNWFKGNFASIIKNSKTPKVKFDEIKRQWYPKKSIRRILNSHSRSDHLSNVHDYLRRTWNSPGSVNAPDSFLGVVWSGEIDKSGNCIYNKTEL